MSKLLTCLWASFFILFFSGARVFFLTPVKTCLSQILLLCLCLFFNVSSIFSQSSCTGAIDVAAVYGIKADGVTDNYPALQRLNADWRGADKCYVEFVFPAGQVNYSKSFWLDGIDSFKVIGKNTNFVNTANDVNDMGNCPLNNSGLLITGGRMTAGHRFKTVEKGSATITLIDAASYSVGDRIFIAGYEEQFYGYPPNPRFFEWNTVRAINGSVITLGKSLRWAYNENWKDVANMLPVSDVTSFGKPRIYKINNYSRYAVFKDCNFLRGPGVKSYTTSAFRYISDVLICENVYTEDFWPSENRVAIYTNCRTKTFELDKMNEFVKIEGCTVSGGSASPITSSLTGATGVDSLVLIKNTFENYCPLSPRVLYASGNTFKSKTLDPPLYPHPEATWVEKVYLKDNVFFGGDKPYTSTMYRWTKGSFTTISNTSNSVTFSGLNNVPAKLMGHGGLIKSNDGATAIVTDISWDGANWLVNLGSIKGTLSTNQIWNFNTEEKVVDLCGNSSTDGKMIYPNQTSPCAVTSQPNAPTLNLTSPTTGSNFTAPATINITADASDADGTITKLEFFNGATKIGEDSTAPYSFSWNNVTSGNYTITAKATDNGGLSTVSSGINISVNVSANIAPTLNLTSPTTGSNFTAPATINITADASDADGTIAKVEFFNGATKIGGDSTAPYSFSWINVASGNYTITAKATDNGGLSTVSSGINISVNVSANIAPTLNLTSPTTGSNFTAPATINITADASDADGTITKLEFFNGATKLGEDLSAPYSFSWSNVASGSYTITAKATDNGGLSTVSSGINMTVNVSANIAPTLNLTSPTTGSNFTAPAIINITADASDTDGAIAKVEFFNGATKIGEDSTAPYSFSWSNIASGDYTITAKATDNGGLSSTSSQSIGITVSTSIANFAPSLALTSPTSGSNFTAPATINITADASDADGTITKLEFFNGATKLGEDLSAPYSFSWSNIASGDYTITAKATDNGGLSTTSQSVDITVSTTVANIAPRAKLTSPTTGSNFTAPATINITADASDADGTITKVEFFNGATKLGEDLSAPYSFSWDGVVKGNYSIKAKATDDNGLSTNSQTVNIKVSKGTNLAPTVSLTSPTTGSNFTAPATINITADASDADGTITKVEFFNGATKLGEDLSAPYSLSLSNVASGSYTITAKATDDDGLSTTSQSIDIIVSASIANLAPVVALTSPSSGSNFTVPATINITADASDADGTVAKVEFFNGATKVGEDLSAPYSFSWSNVASGSYTITAKATDSGGLVTTSQGINITVHASVNLAPVVAFTSPTSGSNFTAPATINITADASDTDGSIAKVEFFNGATKLGEDLSAPYSFSWSNVASGNYTITAKATDDDGLSSTTSQSVDIVVSTSVANLAPVVSLTSPTTGSTFPGQATISLTADASDTDGSIAKVEFFSGTIKLGEDISAPYSFDWSGIAAGTYTIIARATDNGGLIRSSQTVTIFIINPPVAPTVSLTSTTRGNFSAPANIILNASASDADGSINKVEFFVGGTKIGESTNAPYTFTWNNVPAGVYFVVAWATDNTGLMAVSQPMEVVVIKPNEAPAVKITSPTVNSIFSAPAKVILSADASDADGTIAKVEFYIGSSKIGEVTSAPFHFTWTNVAAGTYNITAKATDNEGASAISSIVSLVVREPGKLQNYPNPFSSTTTIEFSLASESYAELQIFNTQGLMVATAFKGIVGPGIVTRVPFDRSGLPNGTYFCRLIYNDGVSYFTKWLETKMVIIK